MRQQGTGTLIPSNINWEENLETSRKIEKIHIPHSNSFIPGYILKRSFDHVHTVDMNKDVH